MRTKVLFIAPISFSDESIFDIALLTIIVLIAECLLPFTFFISFIFIVKITNTIFAIRLHLTFLTAGLYFILILSIASQLS
jgi:hypothetical protein